MSFNIVNYKEDYKNEIISIWEKSVLATHDFLSSSDFEEIKVFLQSFNFHDLNVFCLKDETEIIGFMAEHERKVEMLFVKPEYFGKGFGKDLLNYAINTLKAKLVDVNEQNINAFNFYRKFGFEVVERTEKDDQGRDYPILKMKLIN